MDPTSGAVLPGNFVPNTFIHFTADILDESLDGKNTFHAARKTLRINEVTAEIKFEQYCKMLLLLESEKEKQNLFFKSQSLSMFSTMATTNRTCSKKQMLQIKHSLFIVKSTRKDQDGQVLTKITPPSTKRKHLSDACLLSSRPPMCLIP